MAGLGSRTTMLRKKVKTCAVIAFLLQLLNGYFGKLLPERMGRILF
jgi:hypothetical protein